MGNKKQKRAQIEKLLEIETILKRRELELKNEKQQLQELQFALHERERGIASAEEERARSKREDKKPEIADSKPSDSAPVPAPQKPTAEEIVTMNGILRTIYLDYTSSVHQISSQLSAVTAALLVSAVTCMLENRGFDAKDDLLARMQTILQGSILQKTGAQAPEKADEPKPQTPPAPKPEITPAYPFETVSVRTQRPLPERVPDLRSLDANDEEDELFRPLKRAETKTQLTEDGILRIGSVIEFQKLGDQGFRGDSQLVRIELPEGIQYLPGSFFYECVNLEEIWLPDSLLEIGPYSFFGCGSLSEVHISEKSALREIGEYAFAGCGALRSFTVPPRTVTLNTSVFRRCSSLETLIFPNESKLRVIGSHLCNGCTSLINIQLPDSVTVIPTSMFHGCLNLEKVVANGVVAIEDYAFYGNTGLRTVTIRLKNTIAPQAFEGCDPSLAIETLDG